MSAIIQKLNSWSKPYASLIKHPYLDVGKETIMDVPMEFQRGGWKADPFLRRLVNDRRVRKLKTIAKWFEVAAAAVFLVYLMVKP